MMTGVLMVFLNHSGKMPGQYLKFGNDRFLPSFSRSNPVLGIR
jgi:hypothetical protein